MYIAFVSAASSTDEEYVQKRSKTRSNRRSSRPQPLFFQEKKPAAQARVALVDLQISPIPLTNESSHLDLQNGPKPSTTKSRHPNLVSSAAPTVGATAPM
jgi:hypothetical protein